ncbi:hypothetical protein RchiOBHm_Chr5g0046281 [Rosa chinensis]|uniref:Uncharacterized protein n=1 Tax=Rosa chinensis TaxID=74649 RepID=A0A2P6QE42_ROSCH|nr:hypothetical protein RchiOBHm_Chr5g0046281 [Rosa chinensis]
MGLQRKVPECWKLATRRLASLCEKSDAERETLCWILCGYDGVLCFAYQHCNISPML